MKIVNIGAMVTLSDHATAQIYTVMTTFSSHGKIKAQLMYISENGRLCPGGIVDVTSLAVPTIAQLTK